jgi:hypothetical protein
LRLYAAAFNDRQGADARLREQFRKDLELLTVKHGQSAMSAALDEVPQVASPPIAILWSHGMASQANISGAMTTSAIYSSYEGEPTMALMLRPNADSPDDQLVMHGEWEVGRIDKRPSLTGPGFRWFWALNRVPDGPNEIRLAGVTATLDEAEAALKLSWEHWLAWANLSDVKAF